MQAPFSRAFTMPSEAATTRFAAGLAPLLRAGDTLLLSGGLGAGKTHFARGLIQARLMAQGLAEEVPSPTYTLVQTYHDGDVEIWHCDLYRLSDPQEVDELGLAEAFDEAICLVEWPDRLPDVPPGALRLHFRMGVAENTRHIDAASDDQRWQAVFDRLGADV